MNVKDIMQRPVITANRSDTLNEAARCMWDHDLGSLPVVDDEGRLAGMITDRDVCMAAYTQGRSLAEIATASAMCSQVLACHVDDSVETAEQLMREGQVRRLPVVDNDGRPIGVVALNDLTRIAANARKSTVDRDVIQTLAAISAPRLNAGDGAATHLTGPAALA
jgi:CBS domain-containing protein